MSAFTPIFHFLEPCCLPVCFLIHLFLFFTEVVIHQLNVPLGQILQNVRRKCRMYLELDRSVHSKHDNYSFIHNSRTLSTVELYCMNL